MAKIYLKQIYDYWEKNQDSFRGIKLEYRKLFHQGLAFYMLDGDKWVFLAYLEEKEGPQYLIDIDYLHDKVKFECDEGLNDKDILMRIIGDILYNLHMQSSITIRRSEILVELIKKIME